MNLNKTFLTATTSFDLINFPFVKLDEAQTLTENVVMSGFVGKMPDLMIANSQDLIYKHMVSISNWYNKLNLNENSINLHRKKRVKNNLHFEPNQKVFDFRWNFSTKELNDFFIELMKIHCNHSVNIINNIIILSNLSCLYALVYKDNKFMLFDPETNKTKVFYDVAELCDGIYTSLLIELDAMRYALPLAVEIYNINKDTNNRVSYPYELSLCRKFFNQRIEKLKQDSVKGINQHNRENFKLWAYYSGLIGNFNVHEMLSDVNLKDYGLVYKIENFKNEDYQQNCLRQALSHIYLKPGLMIDMISPTNPLELSLRESSGVMLAQQIRKYYKLLNIISEEYNATPLMQAAYLGKNDALKLLIEHKAKINLQNHNGLTALSFAILGNNLDGCKLLLHAGAKLNLTKSCFSPLIMAVKLNQLAIGKLLIENGINIEERDVQGYTALHLAVREQKIQFVQLLLQCNADPNCKAINMLTPLHTTISFWNDNYKVIAQLLLQHGADPNLQDKEGNTSLHIAATHGYGKPGACNLLLAYDVNINAVNNIGNTAMHEAVINNSYGVFLTLLKANANLYIKNKNNKTVLHVAVDCCSKYGSRYFDFSNKFLMVRQLLERGANPNLEDCNGPLLLRIIDITLIYKLLLTYSAKQDVKNYNGETVLHLAVKSGNVEICRLYLESKLPVDLKTKEGSTALHYAVIARSQNMSKLLLEFGASIEEKDNKEVTALHIAAKQGSYYLTKFLLECNASVDVIDVDGNTPLHLAARFGYTEICSMLIKKGAHTNIIGKDLCTPLMVAYYNGHLDICKVLLDYELQNSGGKCLNSGSMLVKHEFNKQSMEQIHTQINQITTMDLGKWGIMLMLRKGLRFDNASLKDKFLNDFVYTADEIYKELNKTISDTNSDSEIKKLFYGAIVCGRADVSECLLKNGTNPNIIFYPNNNENNQTKTWQLTPLHLSIVYGRKDIFQLLIEHGANCNNQQNISGGLLYDIIYHRRMDLFTLMKGELNNTHLFLSIEDKDEEACELLLSNGINANAVDNNNYTALYTAIEIQQEGIAKLLLKYNADPELNLQNDPLYSCLAEAGSRGQVGVYKLLIEHGANVNKRFSHMLDYSDDKKGISLLAWACSNNNKALCELLVETGVDINGSDGFGESLVESMVDGFGVSDISETSPLDSRLILVKDNDINDTTDYFLLRKTKYNFVRTFDNAFDFPQNYNSNYEMCELLLQHGADPNLKLNIFTPIRSSIINDALDFFKLLLKHGAKIDISGVDYKVSLMQAIKNKNIAICKTLLEEKQTIEGKHAEIDLYWEYVINTNNSEICKLMLEHGADPNATVGIQMITIYKEDIPNLGQALPILQGNDAVLLVNIEDSDVYQFYFIENRKYVYNADGSLKTVTIEDTKYKDNSIDYYVRQIALKNEALKKSHLSHLAREMPILEFAVINKKQAIVEELLKTGASIEHRNQGSLLHIAIEKGYYSIAETLIEHGAKLNCFNVNGYTPLGIAVLYGREQLCKLLIDNGADVNLSGTKTYKPLFIAHLYSYKNIAKLLIKNKAKLTLINKNDFIFPYKDKLPLGQVVYQSIFANVLKQKKFCFTGINSSTLSINDNEVLQFLLEWEDKNRSAEDSEITALQVATSCGLINICKMLLAQPVNASLSSEQLNIVMNTAIEHGYLDICKLLIKHIGNYTTYLDTWLLLALAKSRNEIAKYLVKANANINTYNKNGYTPLAIAAAEGDERQCQFLLRLKADVNFSINNKSPLELAIHHAHDRICKLLCRHGANGTIVNKHYETAIELAINKGNDLLYDFLLSKKIKQELLH
jgi:ankyrin repeat protein